MRYRALFSLFDQAGCVGFARQLAALGWEVVATSETSRLLKDNGVPVKNIYRFLNVKRKYPFPPTLHPFLELALTAQGPSAIDLVYISTYPLTKGNDVGGHTILALAAKGKRIPVFNRADMERVLRSLRQDGQIPLTLRQELIHKAQAKIINHFAKLPGSYSDAAEDLILTARRSRKLLEGENPYQVPAYLFKTPGTDPLGLGQFRQISGNAPCFTNMADLDCLTHTLSLATAAFLKHYRKTPFIAIAAKHGNAVGFSIDWRFPRIALEQALGANPQAIFGGELILNFPVSPPLAKVLWASKIRTRLLASPQWNLDMVAAPGFTAGAVEILKKRQRLKLLCNKGLALPHLPGSARALRMVRGGMLIQPPHNYVLNLNLCAGKPKLPQSERLDSLIIAWATAWNSSHGGNEVALAKKRMLLSAAGGPSTLEACRTLVERAKRCGHPTQNSVFGANAFFPFQDGPEILVKAGCRKGIVPAGGRNFELIKRYFEKNSCEVFYLPEEFRGFSRH